MTPRSMQFGLTTTLGLIAMVASVFARNLWVTLAVFEIGGLVFCVGLLTANLPTAIKKAMTANCMRQDGSWSSRRERIERRALRKLRWDLVFDVALVIMPTNALLLLLNSELIPFSIGYDAITSFRPSEREWKDELRGSEQSYDSWAKQRGTHESKLDGRKRLLWYGWPVIVAAGVVWVIGSFVLIGKLYFQALQELSAEIQMRTQQ